METCDHRTTSDNRTTGPQWRQRIFTEKPYVWQCPHFYQCFACKTYKTMWIYCSIDKVNHVHNCEWQLKSEHKGSPWILSEWGLPHNVTQCPIHQNLPLAASTPYKENILTDCLPACGQVCVAIKGQSAIGPTFTVEFNKGKLFYLDNNVLAEEHVLKSTYLLKQLQNWEN